MKKCVGLALSTVLLAALLLGVVNAQNAENNAVIRVRGTDNMAGRIDGLSKVFVKNNTGTRVFVSGGSKGTGFEGLLDKSCEVAMVDRKLTDQEKQLARSKGVDIVERLVGNGGIVVEVHPSNPVSELTLEEFKKICRGACTNWKDVGGKDEAIQVFSIGDEQGGTIMFMQNDLLNGPFVNTAVVLSGFASVLKRVAEAPGGIGYTRVRDAFESPVAGQVSFKVLKIKQAADSPAVMPSRETVADGTYPLLRPYYLYVDAKNTNATVTKLVEFLAEKGWGKQQVQ